MLGKIMSYVLLSWVLDKSLTAVLVRQLRANSILNRKVADWQVDDRYIARQLECGVSFADEYQVPGKPNLGKNARETATKMIRSTTLWPFRQRANPCLTEAQYEGLLQGAERELQQDSLKLYLNVYGPLCPPLSSTVSTDYATGTSPMVEDRALEGDEAFSR